MLLIAGNIFIQYNQMLTQSPESGIEEDLNEGSEEDELTDQVTYKIGEAASHFYSVSQPVTAPALSVTSPPALCHITIK